MITFDQERLSDFSEIEQLLDAAFGTERFKKSSHVLRNDNSGLNRYSCVARAEDLILATVRFTEVHVKDLLFDGNSNALLLGPLAVSATMRGAGLGSALAEYALANTDKAGHKRILLVGDIKYYARFGFEPVQPRYITMPGGRDAGRLLVKEPTDMPPLPLFGQVHPRWCNFDDHYMLPEGGLATAA